MQGLQSGMCPMTGQSYWGSWLASSMSPRTLRLWTALSDAWQPSWRIWTMFSSSRWVHASRTIAYVISLRLIGARRCIM